MIVEHFAESPIINVTGLARRLERTFPAINNAIPVLVAAGVFVPSKKSGKSQTYEAKQTIDAITSLERLLASPDDDTRFSTPRRAVPAKPS